MPGADVSLSEDAVVDPDAQAPQSSLPDEEEQSEKVPDGEKQEEEAAIPAAADSDESGARVEEQMQAPAA